MCSNCQRRGKKCDYSIKLTWGGRPYKNPKPEMLNQVANMSSSEFARQWKASPLQSKSITFEEVYFAASDEKASGPKLKRKSANISSSKNEYTTALLEGKREAVDSLSEWIADVNEQVNVFKHAMLWYECRYMREIPRTLRSLPDLLNNSYYYEAFSLFCNNTSLLFTVADPDLYMKNPLRLLLPSMGMAYDGILALIIAYGLVHKSNLLNESPPIAAIDSLLNISHEEIMKQPSNDVLLPLVVFLSSYPVFSVYSGKSLISVQETKEILLRAGYARPFERLLTDLYRKEFELSCDFEDLRVKLLFCVLKWFAYVDIFTLLSSTLEPTDREVENYNHLRNGSEGTTRLINTLFTSCAGVSSCHLDYEYSKEVSCILGKDDTYNGIDFMLGFNPELFVFFFKLSQLIRVNNLLRRVHEHDQKLYPWILEYRPDSAITESALDLEKELWRLGGESSSNEEGSPNDDVLSSLDAANRCFSLMGLIHLYRRVLLIPQSSCIIQKISATIIRLVHSCFGPSKSQGAFGVILPLIAGGCECNNPAVRQLYTKQMQCMSLEGYPAFRIMKTCWDTGKNWYQVKQIGSVNAILGGGYTL